MTSSPTTTQRPSRLLVLLLTYLAYYLWGPLGLLLALVPLVQRPFNRVVEKVTIMPRGRALGVTLVTQDEEQFLHTRSEMLARIEMLLGGRAAELLVLGEASSGASDDLKRASELAYKMVSELGLGKTLGAFSYAALNADTIPSGLHDQLLGEPAVLYAPEIFSPTLRAMSVRSRRTAPHISGCRRIR